jgi:hypothetical protein
MTPIRGVSIIYFNKSDDHVPRKATTAKFLFLEIVVYYESLKRELKTKPIYEFRCDERLQTKSEEFTRLAFTLLCVELEHIKIETRLIDEKFASVKGECEI